MIQQQTKLLPLVVALLGWISLNGFSQTGTIRIIDSQTRQLVPFANIQLEPIGQKTGKVSLAADSGLFHNTVMIRSTIRIHCLGYITASDTIFPGQSKTISLLTDPFYVNEVVVTGQGSPVTADQSIYKINVIGSQIIKDKAATNLSELLSNELAMRTFQDPYLGTNLTMQGLSGEQVKILVDGIPVIGRQDGILDLSQLSLSNVDHVEMIEGPMSVIYGSNALAGVVNIISKDPALTSNLERLNAYYETVGIYNFDGSVNIHKNHHHFRFNIGRNFFGGYSATDTSRSQDWKPKLQYFGGLNYEYESDKSDLHLGIDYFNEELINRGGLALISDSMLQNNTYVFYLKFNATDAYQYTTRMNVKIDYTVKISGYDQWQTVAGYSWYNQTIKTVETDPVTLIETPAPAMDQDTTNFYDVMFRSIYSVSGNHWINYITGIDGVTETGTGNLLNGKKETDEEALFMTTTLFPKHKLSFQAGARYIHNSKYPAPLVYSINLKYNPISKFIIRISAGKGFRSPSLQELYLNFTDANHDVHGNDSLKAEYSYNFNFSADYSLAFDNQSLTFEGSLFYNTFHNKIDFLFDASDPSWAEYYNIPEDKYITKGGKVIVTYKLYPGFEVSGGFYSLWRSKIGIPGEFYYTTDYTCMVKYQHPRLKIRFSVFYKNNDNWYANALNKEIDGSVIQYVQAYSLIKGYQSLNFTMSRAFTKNNLNVTIGCKNVFNVNNVFSSSTGGLDPHTSGGNGDTPIGWGRTFFIQLNCPFNFRKI